RLGRVLRREQRWIEALQAYDSLEKLNGIAVAGMPATLVARAARRSVLVDSGNSDGARRQAAALWSDLIAGKWKIGKATLETYLTELKAAYPELTLPADWEERMSLAAGARFVFEQQADSGRAVQMIQGQVISATWERQGDTWKARLIGPSTWQALWTKL